MRITAIINDDQSETYKSKRTGGDVTGRTLSLVDVGQGAKLKQICEWNPPAEFEFAPGAAVGQRVVLDITEITMFGQRPRLRGVVVSTGE